MSFTYTRPSTIAHGVAFLGDHALHERLLRIERVVQHDDVAAPRLADAVDELVDDQPILILERRRHALAFDARDLEPERDDEDGVDRRRHERLHPRHQLFLDLREADAGLVRRAGDGVRTLARAGDGARREGRSGSIAGRASAAPRSTCARQLDRAPAEPSVRRILALARRVYSFRYSRSRRVCVRLTGISVAFSSFIRRM